MSKKILIKFIKATSVCVLLLIPNIVNAENETIKINGCPTASITIGQNKELSVNVTPEDSEIVWEWKKAEESTTAEITLENGKVTAVKPGNIIVTAKIKDTEIVDTCNISIIRDMSDANIDSLTISNGTLDKSFNKDITEYLVTVDSTVTKLNFKDIILSDPGANYMNPNASDTIKNGSIVKLIVTAQDNKTTKTYTFKVVQDTVNLNLKTLKINGYPLNEVFDPEVLEYTASIPYEIDTISLETKAEDTNMKIVPSGLTGLKVGENTVKVTVKDENNNSRIYIITVTREEENKIEENPTSIITSKEVIEDIVAPEKNEPSNMFLKYAIVSLACLILFIIGVIGIYFYLKTSPKKLKKEITKLKSAIPSNENDKEELEDTKEI